ncbi:hypothetical protein [Desulforamulus aeronauticus]|uniref:Uncharacterized protein n=1 Tax=Desulforamulus aeronauticus DSM 10349 TaxID=1121421 RepID=A0A1M6RTZ0_9FIRM|nr:hypothetical protein [Desulforamulus aeronauticus]SHK35848.1 hypothetical protein SAMN02745123_01615 [Desulforamulus aeronauticus DSM 10349]
MTLHNKRHTLQSGVMHQQAVTNQGELVNGSTEAETSQKEMAPRGHQIRHNPMKTAPNTLTNKNDDDIGMGEKG